MKGRELDGGNDDKEPKRRASIGVFLYTNKHFIVSTGYNLHYTRKKEFDGGIDDKEPKRRASRVVWAIGV
jgi:hypothetical protein